MNIIMGEYLNNKHKSLLSIKRAYMTTLILIISLIFKFRVKAGEIIINTNSTSDPPTKTLTNGIISIEVSLERMIDTEEGFIQIDRDRNLEFSGTIPSSSSSDYPYTISLWVYLYDSDYSINLFWLPLEGLYGTSSPSPTSAVATSTWWLNTQI